MKFSDYDLALIKEAPTGFYRLGNGVLLEMAISFNCDLGTSPSEEGLSRLIAKVGPHAELQRNIEHVSEVLGPNAVDIAADWLDRSGVMDAVSGSFLRLGSGTVPEFIDAVVWSGGVANWQLRRLMTTLRLDPTTVGRVVLAMGNRLMGVGEHQLVATYARKTEKPPREFKFAQTQIVPILEAASFNTELLVVDNSNGDEVYRALFREFPELLRGTILTVGNAPNTIQGAGQLRAIAREARADFDADGQQLFVVGDHFPVARRGEDKATHQNPLSGLGQLARNALFLYRAVAA